MDEIFDITGKLVIDYRARVWCKLPYPDHPNGCPNYGVNPECPPQVAKVDDWIDLSKQHWIIVTKFDLASHVKRMKQKHPNWSDKQARCVLYWQNTPRKELRQSIKEFQQRHTGTISTLLPEAMGVHVLATAKKVGIPIIAKPTETIYKIALVGYPKSQESVACKCSLHYFMDTPLSQAESEATTSGKSDPAGNITSGHTKLTKEMTLYKAKDIVKYVGMEDRTPEPYTPLTTIGFCHEVTECLFCGASVSFNGLKHRPMYCHTCITHARELVAKGGE